MLCPVSWSLLHLTKNSIHYEKNCFFNQHHDSGLDPQL